jgi:hypothetical protein
MSREMDLLLAALDQAYDHKSWHGTNLKGALRGFEGRGGGAANGSRPTLHP